MLIQSNSCLWLECVRERIASSSGNLTILSGQTLLFRLVRQDLQSKVCRDSSSTNRSCVPGTKLTEKPSETVVLEEGNAKKNISFCLMFCHVRSGKMVDIFVQIFPNCHLAESTNKKAVSKGSTAKSVSILYGYNHQSSFSTYLSFV